MKDINLFKSPNSVYLKKVSSKSQTSKEDFCDGYLIESSEKEARRIIDSLKDSKKIIAIKGSDDAFNRRAVETLKINYLVSPEIGFKKDTLKQRDSGINHVVAREAVKKKISFVIDMSQISRLKGKERAKALSRIIQNIKTCRKAKCGIKIASFASDKNGLIDENARIALGVSLRMSSLQARDCAIF